jgi:AraC-like DNA-binding protein
MHDRHVGSYREFDPPAGLACTWIRSSSEPGTALVLPDGCTDLIWSEVSGELLIAGPDTGPHPTTTVPGRLLGVRFLPGVGPSVFGIPGHAIADQRIAGTEVWRDACQIAESLNESDRPLKLLTSIAVTRMRRAKVDPLAAVLREEFDLASLAQTIGVSDRQLRRRCHNAFGYGPKTLNRVLRFDRAVGLARSGVSFAQVAATTGFADQAHLCREVKALAGAPLSTLVSRDGRTRAA